MQEKRENDKRINELITVFNEQRKETYIKYGIPEDPIFNIELPDDGTELSKALNQLELIAHRTAKGETLRKKEIKNNCDVYECLEDLMLESYLNLLELVKYETKKK